MAPAFLPVCIIFFKNTQKEINHYMNKLELFFLIDRIILRKQIY